MLGSTNKGAKAHQRSEYPGQISKASALNMPHKKGGANE